MIKTSAKNICVAILASDIQQFPSIALSAIASPVVQCDYVKIDQIPLQLMQYNRILSKRDNLKIERRKKFKIMKITSKRLAKRSIIGTRVCAPGSDGLYHSGVIQAVKTPASSRDNQNSINITPSTRYTVRFDQKMDMARRPIREFGSSELIGPGFRGMPGVFLKPSQKVFLTFNGRECSGDVVNHDTVNDEVTIRITPIGCDVSEVFFSFFIFLYLYLIVIN